MKETNGLDRPVFSNSKVKVRSIYGLRNDLGRSFFPGFIDK